MTKTERVRLTTWRHRMLLRAAGSGRGGQRPARLVDGRLAVQQTKQDHGTVAKGSYARSRWLCVAK